MTPDQLVVLVAVLLILAAMVLAYLAHRGRVSWAWAVGLLGAAFGLLGMRRPRLTTRQPVAAAPPPRPPPARVVLEPVLDEADKQHEAELAQIEDANDDDDRLARLNRLAGLNDGGRD